MDEYDKIPAIELQSPSGGMIDLRDLTSMRRTFGRNGTSFSMSSRYAANTTAFGKGILASATRSMSFVPYRRHAGWGSRR